MSTYADRLKALREQLKADRLDGFVVPLTDEHMSEYVGSYAQRLAWLTGFEGSAGSAVVLPQEAAIFVDGRYTLQVREQVDGAHWSYQSVPQTSIADWLGHHAKPGARIGYDPWLHTKGWVAQATAALAQQGAHLGEIARQLGGGHVHEAQLLDAGRVDEVGAGHDFQHFSKRGGVLAFIGKGADFGRF